MKKQLYPLVALILTFGFYPIKASAMAYQPRGEVGVTIPKLVLAKPLEAMAVPLETIEEEPIQAPEPVYTAPVYAPAPNDAKAFIYMKESGNNPAATNPQGCFGLGQDCNGVVRARCGTDYACQDQYFTEYANSRYGGWDGAYQFWLGHSWW